MLKRFAITLPLLTLFISAAGFSLAEEAPKNLQVLPKSMGRQDVIGVMKQWTQALGVRCDFCHVLKVPGDFHSFDWPSDEKEHKLVARRMLKLVMDLNRDALPAATGEDDAAVSCITCHRGLHNPATIDRVMLKIVDHDGVDAALSRYHDLRERYYGSGSYDFGPRALLPLIEELAGREGGLADALQFARLGVEQNPGDADSRVVLASLLLQSGDRSGVKAAIDKALELDPGNRGAERMRKQLED